MSDEDKGATTFGDLPLAAKGKRWDAAAAAKRVKAWAGAEDKPNPQYRKAFFWFDGEKRAEFGAYKLPFADVVDGKLVAVPRGVFAAAAAIQGARGGVNIPEADVGKVKTHIGRYYAKMQNEWDDVTVIAPWKKGGEGPSAMEYKTYPSEFKVIAEQRIVEAYVSVFGNEDEGGDVVERGFFEEELALSGHRVKACWQHDWRNPIGKPMKVEEDSKGLFTVTKVSRTRLGDDAMVLIEDTVITECSIGYTPIKYLIDEETGLRHLITGRLFEYSFVSWAMNELATITGVKAGDYMGALKAFAALQGEVSGARLLDPAYLGQLIGALEDLRKATPALGAGTDPGHVPPSPNVADDAADPFLTNIAADLSAFVSGVKVRDQLEAFARRLDE